MGLDMYLYRATRKNIEDLKRLKKVEDDLNKMWIPIVEHELPNDWDKSKMTKNQIKLFDEWNDEFYAINQKRRAIYNEMNCNEDENNCAHIGYFWNFNTLHQYIIDNFSDEIYDGQVIPLTKDDVVKILNHLNKIDNVLSSLNMEMKDDYYYCCTCEVPDEIKLPLVLVPYDGRLLGQIAFYKSFVKNIKKSIEIFSMIERELDAEHCVCYRASW